MNTAPVVPGYVAPGLLVIFEVTAIFVWRQLLAPRRTRLSDALLLCLRCGWLHQRTETIGRLADGVAVGALAFLVALPFVAAAEVRFAWPQDGTQGDVRVIVVAAKQPIWP